MRIPSVMLSPNATNRVLLSVGGCLTSTVNSHVGVCFVFVVVQVTVVAPIGNDDPDCGEQLVVAPIAGSGAGVSKVVGVGAPSND